MLNRPGSGHYERMKQTDLDLDLTNPRIRKYAFLEEMERLVPRKEFVALIELLAPTKATGRRLFPVKAMLCIHLLHQ